MEQRLADALIKTALKKGLRDIEENAHRGIRNLMDLGEFLSEARPPNIFFRRAQQELKNQNSSYYKLAETIVNNTSYETLSAFIMNFGYNSLVRGAEKIRSIAHKEGGFVPWLLIFDSGTETPSWIVQLAPIIKQGKKWGIYSYCFQSTDAYGLNTILDVIEREKDCAFFLRLSANILNDILIRRISKAKNIFLLLEMEPETQAFQKVIRYLHEQKCLYGGVTDTNDLKLPETERQQFVAAEINILFLPGKDTACFTQNGEKRSALLKVDHCGDVPVLTTDFLTLTSSISKCISRKACLGLIDAGGAFTYIVP